MADAVGVMYLGRFVEQGSVANVCGAPRHPYTQSLMAAASHGGGSLLDDRPVLLLEGSIPSPLAVPPGCSFHTRCPRARLIASRDLSSTVETPDGRVPRRCAEDEPVPDPAPNGASIAACHFAGEHQSLLHPSLELEGNQAMSDQTNASEVVIIGGGIYGTSLACQLATAGKTVTLLEASEIASGASGGPGERGVRANGRDIRELPICALSQGLWRLYQEKFDGGARGRQLAAASSRPLAKKIGWERPGAR